MISIFPCFCPSPHSLRTRAVRVRISPGAPIHPRSPTGRGLALNAGQCRVRSLPRVRAGSPIGRGGRLKSGMLQVRVLRGAPILAPFAKRQRHLAYTQTFGGSSPSGSTIQTTNIQAWSATRGPRPITAWQDHFQEEANRLFIRKCDHEKKWGSTSACTN